MDNKQREIRSRKVALIEIIFAQILLIILITVCNNRKVWIISSLFILIFSYFYIKMEKGRLLTFMTIFLTLSYVLHMGQYIVIEFFSYDSNFLNAPNKVTCSSILFINICHISFVIGSTKLTRRKKKISTLFLYRLDKQILYYIGCFCIVCGVVPRLYIDINQMLLQINGNYSESLEQMTQYGWISILAQFFYVGVLILIFLSNSNVFRARIILFIVCLWEIFTMLSGGRIYAISFIISMIYIYCLRVEKPTIKTIIIIGVIVYFGCIIMNIVADMRVTGGFSLNNVIKEVKDSFGKDNPIILFIAEMGGTMKSMLYSVINFPAYSEYAYGRSYIESIITAIPFADSILPIDDNHLVFIKHFRSSSYLGGSWLGEAYYNFSWLGFIVCYLWGKWIGKFENIFAEDTIENNYSRTLVILTFIFYIITYTRDYFARFATPIQMCGVLFVLSYCVGKIKQSLQRRC